MLNGFSSWAAGDAAPGTLARVGEGTASHEHEARQLTPGKCSLMTHVVHRLATHVRHHQVAQDQIEDRVRRQAARTLRGRWYRYSPRGEPWNVQQGLPGGAAAHRR